MTLGHLATEMSWSIGADGLDKAAREWRSEFAEFKAIHAEKFRKKWMLCLRDWFAARSTGRVQLHKKREREGRIYMFETGLRARKTSCKDDGFVGGCPLTNGVVGGKVRPKVATLPEAAATGEPKACCWAGPFLPDR